MVMVSASRPDLCAHRETVLLPIAEIARQLVGLNGRKLTASVGGLPGVRRRRRWMPGGELYGAAEQSV
jgi:hypothetical protein